MIGKRGLNKKGQEGVTLTTLLLIILGVVVVVVIILGFTTGFDFISNIFKVAPGKGLEVAVQSCTISAQSELKTDYCLDLKRVDINGQNKYVTCSYLQQNGLLGEIKLDCGSQALNSTDAAKYCVNKNLKGSQAVLDSTCKELEDSVACVKDLKGKWVDKAECVSPGVDETKYVGAVDRATDAAKEKVCCVGLPSS